MTPPQRSFQIGITCTPKLKDAFLKLQESSGGVALGKLARDICVAFLVSNGFLENAKDAETCVGVPQSYIHGTTEEKAAILEKMREKTALMNKKNAEAGQPRKPRRIKAKPKPRTIVIAPAQIDETNRTFTREQLKDIIAEQVKAALREKGLS